MKKTIKEAEIKKLVSEKVIQYAESASPEVWHQMVMDWNWDNDYGFFQWLVYNPNAERATILMIYWMSGPRYGFSFKDILEEKYIEGYYKNQSIGFHPECDADGYNWTIGNREILNPQPVPEMMYKEVNGRNIECLGNYIEGIPEHVFYEIENLYDEYIVD